MSDGSIVFNTKIDNSQVEKDLKDTNRKIQKSMEDISKAENAKIPLVEQSDELSVKLDKAKAHAQALRNELAAINKAMEPGSSPADFIEAGMRKPEVESGLRAAEKEVIDLQGQYDRINEKVEDRKSVV